MTVALAVKFITLSQRQGMVPNIISGLATGLFSIPEGMAYGGLIMLADVNPAVEKELQASGALDVIGVNNVFPATTRVLNIEC